ncbi:LysR family transcriptional regulator [Lapillicoccus jejuensis]|uniref:Molybdate transport repressor ModE-like protein n=1 Tax=Lapillicoccus jejuensis TaxID=402171 RepID=A0A542E2W4_9MICO|nr:LysR family transcriptional regulator [Lapillicoccus jejuensis]TQJ09675.1 molybdate transport repressor ModE-like protein [Lapillicoccus jejuensis]
MDYLPDPDELRLVVAVDELGSVGAAARSLGLAQPSASARLARLERLVGTPLFERDTRGARATDAGRVLADRARSVLAHLGWAVEAARDAADGRRLRVGTVASLAAQVLPVLDEAAGSQVDTVVDHGSILLSALADGALDAAVVAVAGRPGPAAAHLRRHRVGDDALRALLPRGVRPGRGARPWRDLDVVLATYDGSAAPFAVTLAAHVARVQVVATIPAAVALARRRGCAAVVPTSGLLEGPRPGERLDDPPLRHRCRLDLVLPRHPDARLAGLAPVLARELGLSTDRGSVTPRR